MQTDTQRNINIDLSNIGCLNHLTLNFKPGLNIVKAPNASGKSSLIRGFASMFSDHIPANHVLSLQAVHGKVSVRYKGITYTKHFRRTPTGQVGSHGTMLPFSDHRAFDACVALAETGVVHKISGGGSVFRQYLEKLSYGKHYAQVIEVAQELVNELSRELSGPNFRKFEELPLLLTELTELHIEGDQIKEEIASLKDDHTAHLQTLADKLAQDTSILYEEERKLANLQNRVVSEENKEQQLLSFLELTEESSKVTSQIKQGLSESRSNKENIEIEIERESIKLKQMKENVEEQKKRFEQKKTTGAEGLKSLEKKLEQVNKAQILKEEEIQQAEGFSSIDPKYPGRLIIEVRREISTKIDWYNKITEHFQEKYMRRMTTARLRFNGNITKAFQDLGLKGFENIFLDQNFNLHIVRDYGVRQPVETLSASEKLTVSLILMLAAKETFLPSFPFFIVDELTLSYDPNRFNYIMNYLKHHVPYVIVSSLTDSGLGKPEVHYQS